MKLPPLNALRAFEAAARTGSFTLASKEIGVSSAAISQQVRNLEDYLQRKLFFRNNNQIHLTDAGRDLYVNAAVALNQISTFTQGLAGATGPRPLTISAIPALADRWLPDFLATLPELSIRIRVEEDPVELEGSDIDIRLTYGRDNYPGYWSAPLFHDAVSPMCRPDLWTDWTAEPPDFKRARLIQMDWGPSFARPPTWTDWCVLRGVDPPARVALTAAGGAGVLALAEAGAGIALGQQQLARRALRDGRLRLMSELEVPLPQPYMVVISHARLTRGRVASFLAHLETRL